MPVSRSWLFGGGFTVVFWMTRTFSVAAILAMVGGCMGLFLYLLWANQESLLYQPKVFPQYTKPQDNPIGYRNPQEQSMPYEDVYITTPDQVKLHAWFVRPTDEQERKTRATVLFFHANAGSQQTHMGFRMDNIKQMYDKFKLNVLILSYRGYGNSEGVPTEKGLLIDAESIWSHLISRPDVDTCRLLVFGRSLGGSVAIALAARHSPPSPSLPDAPQSPAPYISALIIENTFMSISKLVETLFPLLSPLRPLILRLEWPAIERIVNVTVPILFLSGQKDEVVPASHMQELFDAAKHSRYKYMLKVKEGLHNNTWSEGGQEYVQAWETFLTQWGKGDIQAKGGSMTDDFQQQAAAQRQQSGNAAVDTQSSQTDSASNRLRERKKDL